MNDSDNIVNHNSNDDNSNDNSNSNNSNNDSRCVRGAAALATAGAAAYGLDFAKQIRCEAGVNWDEVRKEVVKVLEDDKYKDSSYEGANPGPLFIRLAWHSAGTFCQASGTGGSAGATMRFEPEATWGANAGLDVGRNLLEPIKKKFPQASYSDLWIFAACVAIEEMGGNKVPFTPGRQDKAGGSECPVWQGATHKDGRLPGADAGSPDKTAAHLRYIFNRMGFNDQDPCLSLPT